MQDEVIEEKMYADILLEIYGGKTEKLDNGELKKCDDIDLVAAREESEDAVVCRVLKSDDEDMKACVVKREASDAKTRGKTEDAKSRGKTEELYRGAIKKCTDSDLTLRLEKYDDDADCGELKSDDVDTTACRGNGEASRSQTRIKTEEVTNGENETCTGIDLRV